MEVLQAELPMTVARLVFHFVRPVLLERQPAVTLRGLLGHALSRASGGAGGMAEDGGFFKPAGGVPHPFVLHTDAGEGVASVLRAKFIFFGRGEAAAMPLLSALAGAEAQGWGPDRVSYRLDVSSLETLPSPWFDAPAFETEGAFKVHFETPTQLTWRNAPFPADGPLLHALVWGASRRIRTLTEHYGAGFTQDRDAIDLLVSRARITRTALFQVNDFRRSSLSQGPVSIGGLTGWFEVEAEARLARLLHPLRHTGVGAKIVAGNGRVRLERIAP